MRDTLWSVSDDVNQDLCHHANVWGVWRWVTVQNWEDNLYLESDLPSMTFSDFNITSCGDRLALSDGAQIFVYIRRGREIVTLFKDFFTGCEVRDIDMNKDYLIVLRNTCVVVYRTSDYKSYFFISFVNGRLVIIKDSSLMDTTIKFENSTVEFVVLDDHYLWVGEYLFLRSAFIVDLRTGDFREVSFPWKCTLMRSNENVIARTDTLLALYTLSGVKSFEMEIVDYTLLNTSKNVLALITDNQLETYDRLTGYRIGLMKKSFFEFHINYNNNIIYGISRSKEKFKVVIESISLLKGHTFWTVTICGDYTSEVRPFLSRFLCYDCTNSDYWYILDAESGKVLQQNLLPKDGRIAYVSDLFWVCQTPEKLFLRFY